MLDEHAGRNDDEHEAAAAKGVDVGAIATSACPTVTASITPRRPQRTADQRVKLPAVELAILDADVAEHESALRGPNMGGSTVPAEARANPVLEHLVTFGTVSLG